jgi:hypothetical protein
MRPQPIPKDDGTTAAPPTVGPAFMRNHPFVIRLPKMREAGWNLYFASFICAASSALWHKSPVIDVRSGKVHDLSTCYAALRDADRFLPSPPHPMVIDTPEEQAGV